MKHKFGMFSDPHIGLNRRAHTTNSSRAALKDALNTAAWDAATMMKSDNVLCLGDLFDTSHNDEMTIMQGAQVARHCNLVLGGNHDVPNREGTLSSLAVVSEILLADSSVVVPLVGKTFHAVNSFGDDGLVFSVPHQSSQDLFDETIQELIKEPANDGMLEIVIMHCNYECGYADNEISLNLTSEVADQLLDRFDYVFIGHEHESRMLKDDRLVLVGNTHPTSFSDIGDKFVWYINQDNEIEKERIWSKDEGLATLSFNKLPSNDDDLKTTAQFIDVTGVLPVDEYAGVADFIVKVWAANPQALMVRNGLRPIETDDVEEIGLTEIDNLPAHITEELKDDKVMQATWEHYLEKLGE